MPYIAVMLHEGLSEECYLRKLSFVCQCVSDCASLLPSNNIRCKMATPLCEYLYYNTGKASVSLCVCVCY